MMITQAKVSIIIPVFNAEKYLHRCIDSVLAQTYKNLEVLLINDGSKDSSGAICDDYAVKDVRVLVFHKENDGASAARNLGLEKSTGDYICFIDADDWVDNNYIASLMPENGEDMVVCSIQYEGEERRSLSISDNVRDKNRIGETLHQMIDHMAVCSPCCKIMRRDIIERNNIRFDIKVSAGEDLLFVCDYISTGLNGMRTKSSPVYHYYVADRNSLSHRIVDFSTTEYVLDCIKERIDNLSKVYIWDSNDGYKRHIKTQLNNFIAYIRIVPSFRKRMNLVKKVIDNKHIRLLLSDTDYIIKHKRLNGFKAMLFRIVLSPLKLYYCFK